MNRWIQRLLLGLVGTRSDACPPTRSKWSKREWNGPPQVREGIPRSQQQSLTNSRRPFWAVVARAGTNRWQLLRSQQAHRKSSNALELGHKSRRMPHDHRQRFAAGAFLAWSSASSFPELCQLFPAFPLHVNSQHRSLLSWSSLYPVLLICPWFCISVPSRWLELSWRGGKTCESASGRDSRRRFVALEKGSCHLARISMTLAHRAPWPKRNILRYDSETSSSLPEHSCESTLLSGTLLC